MNYVGIDHHRQYSHITWLDENGEVMKSGRVANLRRELEGFLQGAREVRAVIEAGRFKRKSFGAESLFAASWPPQTRATALPIAKNYLR